jgi:hypothetical protein
MAATSSADTPVGVVPAAPRTEDCLVGVLEEVFVYPLDDMGFLVLYADVVLDHQLCKLAPVDQHHPGGNPLSVCGGICGEAAGRDEDATVRLGSVKGSDKRLVGCPAFSGRQNCCYFMPRAAGSGTQ